MKKLLFLSAMVLSFSCSNKDNRFHLKLIKLSEYASRGHLSEQNLQIRVFSENSPEPLAQTGLYPGNLPMPATLKVYPAPALNLYKRPYRFELWGDVDGYISSCEVNMDEYKIIFPIDMEVENDSLNISIMGSWD